MERPYRMSDGKARLPNMLGLLNGKTYTPKIGYHAMQSVATLFDGDSVSEPAYYCALSPVAAGVSLVDPYTLFFRRRGAPLLAYYQASDVQEDTPVVPVDVTLSCDLDFKKSADILREPVLIDPVRQIIYGLPAPDHIAAKGQSRLTFRFKNLPCPNYPLIITDRSVVA